MTNDTTVASPKPIRVAHFVTGGFSGGATQVALALVRAQMDDPAIEPLLILRKKRRTPAARIAQLTAEGVPFKLVNGFSKVTTIAALVQLFKHERIDVVLAHGFSEHLWGRYAALLAKVPVIVQVEHNTKERYTRLRLAQSRWLAKHTHAIVGCSDGVRNVLAQQGLPQEKLHAISNGIHTAPFTQAPNKAWAQRSDGIVMVARFSKQKDHATLVRAVGILKERGLILPVYFAGGGKDLHKKPVERLVSELQLGEQVKFLGVCKDVPGLLLQHKFAVLSTHYEGMPLALIEGMAAGCLAFTSRVPGAQEVIRHAETGYLVAGQDAHALAEALASAYRDPARSEQVAAQGRALALQAYSATAMTHNYSHLIQTLHHKYNHQ